MPSVKKTKHREYRLNGYYFTTPELFTAEVGYILLPRCFSGLTF